MKIQPLQNKRHDSIQGRVGNVEVIALPSKALTLEREREGWVVREVDYQSQQITRTWGPHDLGGALQAMEAWAIERSERR